MLSNFSENSLIFQDIKEIPKYFRFSTFFQGMEKNDYFNVNFTTFIT